LAVLLLAAGATAVWWRRDPYRRSRRAALRELRAIRTEEYDVVASARAIESLMRRFAVAVFGGAQVARLTGDAWLAFVATHGGVPLAGETGRSLLATAFGGGARDDRQRWIAGAEAFVRASRARRAAPLAIPGDSAPGSAILAGRSPEAARRARPEKR
jgi:hypothetical protein